MTTDYPEGLETIIIFLALQETSANFDNTGLRWTELKVAPFLFQLIPSDIPSLFQVIVLPTGGTWLSEPSRGSLPVSPYLELKFLSISFSSI